MWDHLITLSDEVRPQHTPLKSHLTNKNQDRIHLETAEGTTYVFIAHGDVPYLTFALLVIWLFFIVSFVGRVYLTRMLMVEKNRYITPLGFAVNLIGMSSLDNISLFVP